MAQDETGSFASLNAVGIASNSLTPKWKTRYPQTLDGSYYEYIGEISARWAWLEFQLGVIAREILGIDKPEGFAVTGGMSMRAICGVLIALTLGGFPKDKPKVLEAVSDLANKLNNSGDLRNEYAHSVWAYEEAGMRLGIMKLNTPRNRAEFTWIHKTLSEMKQNASLLHGYQKIAQEITDALKGRRSRFL